MLHEFQLITASTPSDFFHFFKFQVFPRIELVEPEEGDGARGRARMSQLSSPEYMAAVCTVDTFQEMVQEKVQFLSWWMSKDTAFYVLDEASRLTVLLNMWPAFEPCERFGIWVNKIDLLCVLARTVAHALPR